MPAQPIAAIVYRAEDDIEALLTRAARTLAARGVKLGGVIQHSAAASGSEPCGMQLEDLASGERFALSQAPAAGVTGCRLDPDALARGAVLIRKAVEGGAELVFANKFGAQEAAGTGLRDDIAFAVASGVPVLTAVGEHLLADWNAFTGGGASLLDTDPASVPAWWQALQAGA